MKDIEIKDLKTGDIFIGKHYYNNYYLKVVDKLGINNDAEGLINVIYKYVDRYGMANNDHDWYDKDYIVTRISI
jgi:hypothetical protein